MRKFSITKLNICVSVLHQILTAVSGLIIARIILQSFGSENNGLMQSVSQILGYTVLLEGGIGGVMRAALYKPLAENDSQRITDIFMSGKRFFRKISLIFILFVFVLGCCIKPAINTDFDWLYVFVMVLILGANTYFGYYAAISHKLLLMADQKLYVIQFVQIISTAINLLICVVAINLGSGVHLVKLLTACTAMLGPIFFCFYVSKRYAIAPKSRKNTYKLPQQRDGVIHHLAYFVHRNTDVVLLSLFSSLESVSVYSVYNTVISVLEQFVGSISSGVAGKIGEHWARDEVDDLNEMIDVYEVCNTALTFAIGVVCLIMILPFVSIYTIGVTDTNYIQPFFAALLIFGSMIHCLMQPYTVTISAAGHYKETKPGAIGEVSINLLLSFILVLRYGLIGVAIGTFVAMAFRLLYSVRYLSKAIVKRPIYKFIRCILPNIALSSLFVVLFSKTGEVNAENIGMLFISAIKVSAVVFPLFAVLNFILHFKLLKKYIKIYK